jgi:hypothetical protein
LVERRNHEYQGFIGFAKEQGNAAQR